ncbi:hypothetical protein APHAL10511_003259 [Amanita phalloides]|nr:hypothetical protein APHAL10511_003259 [Amanita phalloides]
MPLIYNNSPRNSSRDDIVLSDLVRTGEASRLRRRGALRVERIDRRPPRWDVYPTASEPPPSPPQIPPPAPQPQPPLALPFPVAPPLDLDRDEHDEYTYVLRCGGRGGGGGGGGSGDRPYSRTTSTSDSESDLDPEHSSPFSSSFSFSSFSSSSFVPSVLPLYPPTRASPPPPDSEWRARPKRQGKRATLKGTLSNGCGAIVHRKAAPRHKLGMWTAKTEAAPSVIHLDSCYFDSVAVGKMVRSVCGCVREGVGCAVCGNPLGTLYTPCKTATDGVFFSRTRTRGMATPPVMIRSSPPQLQTQSQTQPQTHSHSQYPSQPQQAQPSGGGPPATLHVYSFFASAVSSHPPYKFPSSSSSSSSSTSASTASGVIAEHATLNPVHANQAQGQSQGYPSWGGGSRHRQNPNPNPNPNLAFDPVPRRMSNANVTAPVDPSTYADGALYAYSVPYPTYVYPYPYTYSSYGSSYSYSYSGSEGDGGEGEGEGEDGEGHEGVEDGDGESVSDEEDDDDDDDDDEDVSDMDDEGEEGEGEEEDGVRRPGEVVFRVPRLRRAYSNLSGLGLELGVGAAAGAGVGTGAGVGGGGEETGGAERGTRLFFGRYTTASPVPLSDAGDDDDDGNEGEREREEEDVEDEEYCPASPPRSSLVQEEGGASR